MKNKKINENIKSWKALLKFYKKVKIPWFTVLSILLFSFAVKEIESQLVPYTTKIMTGAIDTYGFLGVLLCLLLYMALLKRFRAV